MSSRMTGRGSAPPRNGRARRCRPPRGWRGSRRAGRGPGAARRPACRPREMADERVLDARRVAARDERPRERGRPRASSSVVEGCSSSALSTGIPMSRSRPTICSNRIRRASRCATEPPRARRRPDPPRARGRAPRPRRRCRDPRGRCSARSPGAPRGLGTAPERRSSRTPARVSWSVIASSLTPAAPAAETSARG